MFFYLSKIVTFIIDPVFFILVVCFFGLIKGRRHKLLGLFVFVILYLVSTPIISNKMLSFLEHLEPPSKQNSPYDAVIVLSGMVDLINSSDSQIEFSGAVDRVLAGMEIVKEGKANYLIISGGDGALIQKGRSEALLLKRFAVKWGIREDRILVDADSRNTYENALKTAKIIEEFRLSKLLLITSAFHMYRAHGCFRRVELDVDILPVDFATGNKVPDFRYFLPSSSALAQTSRVLHEFLGILVYGITGRAVYS